MDKTTNRKITNWLLKKNSDWIHPTQLNVKD